MRSFAGRVLMVVLATGLGVAAVAAPPAGKPAAPAPQKAANASDRLCEAWVKSLKTHDTSQLRTLLEKVTEINLKDQHGITPLGFATMAGLTDVADRLLDRGADPDTALSAAVSHDRRIIFSTLLRRGADVNRADDEGFTALMAAAAEPKGTPYARLLIGRGANVNAASKTGVTALMGAAQSGNHETIYLLLRSKAAVNARNSEGKTALMFAAEAGKTVAVQRLLEGGADPNLATPDGSTALTYARQWAVFGQDGPLLALQRVEAKAPPQDLSEAILQRDLAAVRAAIARGENLNGPEKDGTPLAQAFFVGEMDQYAAAKVLIEAGADVNLDALGAPLITACSAKQLDLAKLLLDHKANVNVATDAGYTPLMIAAMDGQTELVKLLLARGADVKLKIPHGETALDLALEQKQDAVVALLKGAGAPAGRTVRAATPPKAGEKSLAQAILDNDAAAVQAALARGEDPDPRVSDAGPYVLTALSVGLANDWKPATLKALLAGRASPSRADGAGMTPLMMAALYPTPEPTRLLLEYGAEVQAQDKDGQTALLFAASAENVETMKLLLAKGAKPDGVPEKQPILVKVVQDLRPGHPKPEVLKLLLASGAKVNLANPKGETALMMAAQYGQVEAAKLLLEKGADPNLAAKDGSTALARAVKARKPAVVAVLRKAGAKG